MKNFSKILMMVWLAALGLATTAKAEIPPYIQGISWGDNQLTVKNLYGPGTAAVEQDYAYLTYNSNFFDQPCTLQFTFINNQLYRVNINAQQLYLSGAEAQELFFTVNAKLKEALQPAEYSLGKGDLPKGNKTDFSARGFWKGAQTIAYMEISTFVTEKPLELQFMDATHPMTETSNKILYMLTELNVMQNGRIFDYALWPYYLLTFVIIAAGAGIAGYIIKQYIS